MMPTVFSIYSSTPPQMPILSERARVKARISAPVPEQKIERNVVTFADLKIRTKGRTLVDFKPNAVQVKYLDMLADENPEFRWRDGVYSLRGIREDVLKARQQGMSTLWLALYFLDTINTPMTQTLILAHDAPTTEKLFKIVHRFYEHLPAHLKRPKKYSSKREIEFSDIDSIISVGTAGSAGVGRGGTVNNVHMSERAFWRDGGDVEIGLMESVPLDGNATRETTANGLNEYADERTEMRDGGGQFKPRFFAWSENPEYAIETPPNFILTEEEEKLARLFDLSDAQLNWRRSKRLSKKQHEKFPQEYPLTEAEAFLSSGNGYFDNEKLTELLVELEDEEFAPIAFDVPPVYRNLRRERDALTVWEEPQPGRVYVIGADTAEGINGRGDHDYDSASVWDAETEVEVARLHGRWNTHIYGLMIAELGFWYNTALLGIERNNHGHAVINAALYTANYPEAISDNSTGLYMHQEYDEKKQPTSRRPGFPTSSRSVKFMILDDLASAVENGDFHARSPQLIAEMQRFVKLPGGKAGAETGHDDRVMDAAIARRMLNLRPRRVVVIDEPAFVGGGY